MSKRFLLFISSLCVIGAAGCELNPPPECLYGQAKCEEDSDGGGLYKTCGADMKWHMLSCGVYYTDPETGSTLTKPLKIGCDDSGKKCAEAAKLPECQKRDYYCFDGNGTWDHGVYVGCVNQLLVPEMCSSGEKCIDDTSQGIISVNKKKCSDGSNEDALACDAAIDKPKCENFDYIKDFNGKNPKTIPIGVQLKCENGVWTPSYCAGGNLCDPREENKGDCLQQEAECTGSNCAINATKCEAMNISEMQPHINTGRIVIKDDELERFEACKATGKCDVFGIYTDDLRWGYTFCAYGCEGGQCASKPKECTSVNQIIPKCSINEKNGEAYYGICMEKNGNSNPIKCAQENNETFVCSEKTGFCAECKPGSMRCFVKDKTSYVQSCSEDEYWVSDKVCTLGCVTDESGNPQCRTEVACTDGQLKCENTGTTGKILKCTDGEWAEDHECDAQASCKSSTECGDCVNSDYVCTAGASEEDKATITYCRDGQNVPPIECANNLCDGNNCESWGNEQGCSNNELNIGYKVTISDTGRTEERCENVSCNADGDDCGECINGATKCELLESPEDDTEDPTAPPYITKVSECENGAWVQKDKGKFSCKLNNTIGECVDSPITCENNEVEYFGTVHGCVNGEIINKPCNDVSCSGVECGDCLDTDIICNNRHMSHVVARQQCVNGKYHVVEFCKDDCDGNACKTEGATTPEPAETP